MVALVCALFLWRLRSSLVAVIPAARRVLAAFIVMHAGALPANLLSRAASRSPSVPWSMPLW